MNDPPRHPGPADLEADPLASWVALHLEGCARCRVERRLLFAGPPAGAFPVPPGLFDAARAAASTDHSDPAALTPGGPDEAGTTTGYAEVSPVPRYEVGPIIGAGSSGEVHRAWDPALRRHVALKILTRDGRGARARFLSEAQVTAQLDHPNIVPIHHLGRTEDGRPFVAAREVRGVSLGEAVRRGRLVTLEERVDALRKVCTAVAHAHSRGVLHRDLKPDNVMVGEFGEVQVVDWGLSRPMGGEPEADPVHTDRFDSPADRTRNGHIAGTPAWMAPEQARGDLANLDARTDVYALGAILFFLAVGRSPVEGGDTLAMIDAVAAGRVLRPRDVDARVPREIDAIVRRAMALDPGARYPDVRAFLEDLDAWIERRPLPHVGSRLPERLEKLAARHRTAFWAVGGTVALALVAAAVGGWRYAVDTGEARDAAAAEAVRARAAERQAIIGEAKAQVALADAARLDGREREAAAGLERATASLGAVGGDLRNAQWALSALVASSPPPLSICEPAPGRPLLSVAVAPDGTAAVALADDGSLVVWDPAGCGILVRKGFGASPVEGAVAWLADGPAAVAWVGRELVHLRPGGNPLARTPLPDGLFDADGRVPDRTRVADVTLHPWGEGALAAPDGQWWTFRFGDPALRREARWTDLPLHISLVPGGRYVFAEVGLGDIERRGLWDRTSLALRELYWIADETSSDGRVALVNAGDGACCVDLGSGATLWATTESPYGVVGVAPGDRYAYQAMGGTIRIYDLATGAPAGRIRASVTQERVEVSRDARLLLTWGDGATVSSWLRGDAARHVIGEETAAVWPPVVAPSPDGRLLAVAGARGSEGVEVLDLATRARLQRLPADAPVFELAFSPDGEMLAGSLADAGIVVWNVVSGEERWRRSAPSGTSPVDWAQDEVLTVDAEGDLLVLSGVDGTERHRWPALPEGSRDIAVVPGSRRVVMGGYPSSAPSALVVDIDDGDVVYRLDIAAARAQVAVSPDGRRAALAGFDGRTLLWDLGTGAVLRELEAEAGPTTGAGFSPDGTIVVTSSWDEQLVFWDAGSGDRLRTVSLGRIGGRVHFAPGGELLVITRNWKLEEILLDAHVRHEAAVAALRGGPLDRARAFAALGWWERVIPELDRGADDPLLRAQAWLAAGRPERAAEVVRAAPDSVYRRVIEATRGGL